MAVALADAYTLTGGTVYAGTVPATRTGAGSFTLSAMTLAATAGTSRRASASIAFDTMTATAASLISDDALTGLATSFTLESSTTQANAPFMLAMGFAEGEASEIALDLTNYQVTVKRTWADGTIKHAVIAGRANLTAATPLTVNVTNGTPPTGTDLTSASITAAAPTATVTCGAFGSVSLASLLASPVRTWISGPQMVECHYRGTVSGTNISVWFHVRLFVDGRMWVRALWEADGYLDNGAGALSAGTTRTFAPTVDIGGVTVFAGASRQHFAHTSANAEGWIGTNPGVTVLHDVEHLMATKLVPNYTLGTPTEAGLNALTQTYTATDPHARGGLQQNMEDVGYQAQIGLLNQWDAMYLRSGDVRAKNAAIAHSHLLKNYPIIFRSRTTNLPIRPSDFPRWTVQGDYGGGSNSVGTGTLTWDWAHHGSGGYLAYLLTGDYAHFETLAAQPCAVYLCVHHNRGLGTARFIEGQTRGVGWAHRSFAQYTAIAPDGDSVANDWRTLFEYQMAAWRSSTVDHPDAPQLGVAQVYPQYADPGGPYQTALFQTNYWVQAMGHAWDIEPGFASTANHQAVRDWMYRAPVGQLGGNGTGNFCFTQAGSYVVRLSDVSVPYEQGLANVGADIGDLYDTWGEVHTATFGTPNTACGTTLGGSGAGAPASAPGGYWGYLMPAIAYAVDHGATDAQAAYDRLTGASNWGTIETAAWDNNPLFGIQPRNVVATPAWLEGVAVNEWVSIPGSSMNGVNATIAPQAGTGPSARIDKWCPLAVDPATGRVWAAANGGHLDYSGNEVLTIDLRDDSPTWTILRQPTAAASVQKATTHYLDGRPSSAHGYWSAQYIGGTQDRIFKFSPAAIWSDNGLGPDCTHVFSIADNDWDGAGTYPNVSWPASGAYAAAGQAQDAATGDVYFVNGSGAMKRFNAATGTFTTLATWFAPGPNFAYYAPMAYDHTRGIALVIGLNWGGRAHGAKWVNDGGNGTWSQQAFTGALSEVLNGQNVCGADYDEDLDSYVVKTPNTSQVFLIHPTTWEITLLATTGDTPPNAPNGVFGRFRRVPALGIFVYYPDYGDTVYALRIR